MRRVQASPAGYEHSNDPVQGGRDGCRTRQEAPATRRCPPGPEALPPSTPPAPDQRFERAPAYPPGYGYDPNQGQGHDRAAEAAAFARRHIRTPETKEFFKTSEFAVWALTFICIVLAGLISETLFSDKVWLYVTILSSAYIVSRGIAKAGSSSRRPREPLRPRPPLRSRGRSPRRPPPPDSPLRRRRRVALLHGVR